ncbi:MAG: hypothetical protein E7637_00360 [Ruminococcaceae bacterium]|nr:hypothetical protein [Oscillospiraceae bacterium]
MSRSKKLASNTLLIGVGTVGSKLLVFLLMPFYTAWLTTAEFGTAELLTSTANLLIPIACLGITNGIFRFAADRSSNKAEVFSSGVALLGMGLAGFVFLSPLLLLVKYFSSYYFLILAYVLVANLQSVCAQYVRAIDDTRLFAIQGIFNTALTVVFNVLFLAVFDFGLIGYVLSVIVGNLVTVAFLVWRAKLWRVFRPSAVRWQLIKEMLIFSLPLVPTTVCWLITDLSDRYMVTAICGEAATGIYSASYKIPTLVNLASGIFMQAWQLSAVAESSDESECSRFYSQVFGGFLSLAFLGSAGLIVCSQLFTGILLNSAYADAWQYMPTLLCAVAFEAVVSFLATVYMVKKKSMHSFLTAMIGTVLNVVLNLLLIPRLEAAGAAIATMVSYGAVLAVRLVDVRRLMRFDMHVLRLLVNVLLLLGEAAVMTYVKTGKLLFTALPALALFVINAPMLLKSLKRLLLKRA